MSSTASERSAPSSSNDRARFLKLADFATVTVTGTTASVADTAASFRHAAGQNPTFWLVLEGDVYVPKGGMGTSTVDVRSRLTSQQFSLLLFLG